MSHVKATLFLLLIDALVFFFCLFLAPMKLLMVLFGFAFIAYCRSFILIKVLPNLLRTHWKQMDTQVLKHKLRTNWRKTT